MLLDNNVQLFTQSLKVEAKANISLLDLPILKIEPNLSFKLALNLSKRFVEQRQE